MASALRFPDAELSTSYGRPAVKVRYGSADCEWIERVIERAWWDRASKVQQMARGGGRP